MSGGFLVVLDRSGKDLKKYEAKTGLVTLGSDLSCDIRILVPSVKPHHATVTVRSKQTVIRDLADGNTFVNNVPVSVHALSHCDIITVGDRSFRWEYAQPQAVKKTGAHTVLPVIHRKRGKRGRPAKIRMSEGAPRKLDPDVHLELELKHRSSMPGSTKQVAVVQPRRRDVTDMSESKRTTPRIRLNLSLTKRTPRKTPKKEVGQNTSSTSLTKSTRKVTQSQITPKKTPRGRPSKDIPDAETKASQWIASRKSDPKKQNVTPKTEDLTPKRGDLTSKSEDVTPKNVKYVHVATPRPTMPYVERSPSKMMASKTPRRVLANKKSTPLRTAVLRKAITPKLTPKTTPRNRVVKIEDPVIDKNKKAALMILTRTSQSRNSTPKVIRQSTPIVVLKKPNTPVNVSGTKSRRTKSTSPKNASASSVNSRVGVVSVSDESDCMLVANLSQIEDSTASITSSTQSPRKSSLKQPNSNRSHDRSIKFDLDNLEECDDSSVLFVSDVSDGSHDATLHLPNTSSKSRSSRILEKSLGKSPIYVGQSSIDSSTSYALAPASPQSPSRSSRSSLIMKNSLNGSTSTEKKTVNSATRSRQSSRVSVRSSTSQDDGMSTPVLGMQELMSEQYDSMISNSAGNTPVLQMERILAPVTGSGRQRATLANRSASLPRPRGRPSRQSAKRSLLQTCSDDSSDHTDENATIQSNEENITPKSTVKLVPEAVKHKHSTAKKPKSKRTLIDNFDRSDIIKNLFNSPVKRKLSRSMIEFHPSSSDEEQPTTSKRTRRTIAANEVTPNQSIDECITPLVPTSVFVSPLDKTTKTPNLDGVKRLFGKNTPKNDLTNIKGVKGLFKTPGVKKSVVNDLTNVSDLGNVFEQGRTPKDNSSTIKGIKKIFRGSPRNDLRRVSGVKKLFQSQKKNRTPKNDLRDVRGVKQLFSKRSPKNDPNVSGVKRILTQISPKNDLRDVRGVKRVFKPASQQNSMNLSGVEELFNEPSVSTSDHLFDELIGRVPARKTYSKSVIISKSNTKKGAGSKSLTNNVTVDGSWLKTAKATIVSEAKNASLKLNKSRELTRLLTDTLAGEAPLQSSRIRGSSGVDNSTLPLKKRSFNTSRSNKNSAKALLPIKKRVIVHSTPVKANRSTIVPTEMGKVSPIATAERTTVFEGTISPKPKSPPKTKQQMPKTRVTKSKAVDEPPAEQSSAKQSPRKTRAHRASKTSPVKRTRTNKRRDSLVISKKPPTMTPKGVKESKRTNKVVEKSKAEVKAVTPKPTRQTRAKPKEATPKNTRIKKVVVKKENVNVWAEKPKRGKTAVKDDNRKRKTVAEGPSPKSKRGKVIVKGESKETVNNDKVTIEVTVATKTRGRRAEVPKEVELPNTKVEGRRRGRKEVMVLDDKKGKTRAKKSDDESISNKPSTSKGRAKKVEVVNEVKKRGRNTKKDTVPEPEKPQRGRKRKADGTPVKETTKRQTRSRKTTENSSPAKKSKSPVKKSKSPAKKSKPPAKETKLLEKKVKSPVKKSKPSAKKSKSPVEKAKSMAKPNSPAKTKTTRAKAAKTQPEATTRSGRRRN